MASCRGSMFTPTSLRLRDPSVDLLQRPAEAATDVEDRLPILEIGHAEQDLVQPVLGSRELVRPCSHALERLVPVPEMDAAADHVREQTRQSGNQNMPGPFGSHPHPQQYIASRSRFSAMKLHAVQRLRGPTTGETWCR